MKDWSFQIQRIDFHEFVDWVWWKIHPDPNPGQVEEWEAYKALLEPFGWSFNYETNSITSRIVLSTYDKTEEESRISLYGE